MRRSTHDLVRLLALSSILFAVASCGDDDGYYGDGYYGECRFQPGLCAGGPGGFCGANLDCSVGFCCRGPKECGGGMCTFTCRSDFDCPSGMACEHDMCLFACRSDFDCAAGQHCAHGHTVCEW
jgi:hypothetical protein